MVVAIELSTLIKIIGYIFVLLFTLFFTAGILTSLKPEYQISSSSVKEATAQLTGHTLYRFLTSENGYYQAGIPVEDRKDFPATQLIPLMTNIALDDPRSLLGHELPGFSLFDGEILVAGEGTNYTNMPYESAPPAESLTTEGEAVAKEITQSDNQPSSTNTAIKTNGKIVHIYFTHTRESYLPALKGVTDAEKAQNSKINVTLVGDRLQKALISKGIGTSIDKTDVITRLTQKNMTYSKSYAESRALVQDVMSTNRNLQYFIDIHRDSQRRQKTTVDISGKDYAKIAFVIGGDNPQYEKNLALANTLHKKINEQYPGLSRGVFEKKGAGTNGKFNQDLSDKALLLEVGGVDNSFDELYRTMDIFAEVFSEHYWDAKAVQKAVQSDKKAQ